MIVVIVRNFLVPPSLILKGSKKGISMHIDSGLLPEESLTITSHLIHDNCVQSHHLLLLKLISLVLKIFDPVERGLSNRHILS